ncbi:MAG: TetR/AcrR family transcriptional regulator [Reinekea sp.]|nr:TetR/AcrR family transcriptional regulator [Reinekea sp.]
MNKGERTRDSILNRGMLHSSQYGLADITIGTISSLTGMSRTGVISHFKNKDDMQIAILDYSEKQYIENVLKPSRHDDAYTQLQQLISNWVNWTARVFTVEQTSCPFVKAIVEYEHRQDSPVRRHAFEQQRRLLETLTGLVAKAQAQGSMVSNVSSSDIAYELYSLYVGSSVASPIQENAETTARQHNMLLRALARFAA